MGSAPTLISNDMVFFQFAYFLYMSFILAALKSVYIFLTPT